MTEPKTYTVDAPGARVTYDVRTNETTSEPVLMLIGSPMGASGFGTLASHFADRTVVTYDPRGAERSTKDDPTSESTPDQHADDLHRVIAVVSGGRPVDLFASSGGAVNALALVARHPEDVRTLVAHEPPAPQVLPDREAALAAVTDIHDTYLRRGYGPAMAKFIRFVTHEGPVPDGFADQPDPDPAMFGLPTADDGSRTDPLVGQNMISCNYYQHDFDALRAAPTRIVIAVGEESDKAMAGRAALVVAEQLGQSAVYFPSHHAGFLGNEFGQAGQPEAFAAKLREVLTTAAADAKAGREPAVSQS
jgi:pimeloyl-ACP methyl ester carboxylesterase